MASTIADPYAALDRFANALRFEISAGFTPERFDALAHELYVLQSGANPAYRALCAGRDERNTHPETWRAIPAAPALAFKELELTSLPPAQRTAVFLSSGTTGQKPSRHWHHAASLAVYEASLLAGFYEGMLKRRREPSLYRVVSLTPTPGEAPQSSLAHMMACVIARWGDAGSGFVGRVSSSGAWEIDAKLARARLDSGGGPVLVLGTAFGWVHLCDEIRAAGEIYRLPAGSCCMETGGYKGRSRELETAELHGLISTVMGVEPPDIVREYGMSELSSQAYDRWGEASGPGGVFRFPPWARACVISPETGRECAAGEPGLLRVWDLANVYSVAVVQTEDRAVAEAGGFRLLGRAPRAEPRGCSLMAA